MAKLFFVFLFLGLGKITSAQAAATAAATATATIVHSVGAGELQSDELDHAALMMMAPPPARPTKNGGAAFKAFDFTTFRVAGTAFVFSISIEPAQTAVNKAFAEKKQLTGFRVRPLAGDAETFALGSLVDVNRARNGEYTAQTKLNVAVHFN
jgi:hypothetical protein